MLKLLFYVHFLLNFCNIKYFIYFNLSFYTSILSGANPIEGTLSQKAYICLQFHDGMFSQLTNEVTYKLHLTNSFFLILLLL